MYSKDIIQAMNVTTTTSSVSTSLKKRSNDAENKGNCGHNIGIGKTKNNLPILSMYPESLVYKRTAGPWERPRCRHIIEDIGCLKPQKEEGCVVVL